MNTFPLKKILGVVDRLEEPVSEFFKLLRGRLRFFLESQIFFSKLLHLLGQVTLFSGLAGQPRLQQADLFDQVGHVAVAVAVELGRVVLADDDEGRNVVEVDVDSDDWHLCFGVGPAKIPVLLQIWCRRI